MNIVATSSEIVECLRIARLIERHGEQFITKVFTNDEIRYCQSRKLATQTFAAFWAGKQAVLKLFGIAWREGMSWRDLELRVGDNGQTTVALRGNLRDLVMQRQFRQIHVSIAHARSHALAHALALAGEDRSLSDDLDEDEDFGEE